MNITLKFIYILLSIILLTKNEIGAQEIPQDILNEIRAQNIIRSDSILILVKLLKKSNVDSIEKISIHKKNKQIN
jgi:hypothetical protein